MTVMSIFLMNWLKATAYFCQILTDYEKIPFDDFSYNGALRYPNGTRQ
jgi:hypothetical protein